MCGLIGFYNPHLSEQERVATATRLAHSIQHRGPDGSATWSNENGLTLAHRRLAILDLSTLAQQPMTSPRTGSVLIYNGEIYNYRTIRTELESLGISFQGSGDTEVLLAAIDTWGLERTLTRCNGMFAICFWNTQTKTLHIARDRIGIKPLYYGWLKSGFAVSSELKPLYGLKDFRLPLSSIALSLFFEHGYISAPYTIFDRIWKLMPGSLLSLSESQLTTIPTDFSPFANTTASSPQSYWQISTSSPPYGGSFEDAVTELDTLIQDSVQLRTLADVPVGAFLSGGIDSSTIVSSMQALSSSHVRTFSIGFEEDRFNEAPHAKKIAHHLGTEHTEHYVTTEDALEVIPQLATLYDEPFADSSQIPTFLLSRLTRQHVTVSLSGDGGDELFRGYPRYLLAEKLWRKLQYSPLSLRKAVKRCVQALPSTVWSGGYHIGQRALPPSLRGIQSSGKKIHRFAELLTASNIQELYLRANAHWLPHESPAPYSSSQTLFHRDSYMREPSLYTSSSPCDYLSYLDLHTYLPDDILTKVDRASMAVGLEARVPLLDHRIIEFSRTIPTSWCIHNGSQKLILKRVLERYVPSSFFERPKSGFAIPLAQWLRKELRPWGEAALTEARLPVDGRLNRDLILRTWQEHQDGHIDAHSRLWNVLMFQQWQERWGANIENY
ncbi:MAG: asparagine synthase (glutamine-hydrolyzing) [Bdellovibrionota bacterium]